MVGKYFGTGDFVLSDAYISVIEAVKHAAYKQKLKPQIDWINSEQFEKEYRCMLDALGQWSAEMPTYVTGKDAAGKDIQTHIGTGTHLEAIREFFKERTNESERIIRATIIAFRNQLTPDVSFL